MASPTSPSLLDAVRGRVRARPRAITAVLSAVGYTPVIGVFVGPISFPELPRSSVLLLGDLIAVINSTALIALLAGYLLIRRRRIRAHRAAMLTAFGLILVFLVLYLLKIGGGFEKQIVIASDAFLGTYAGIVRPVYLGMLAVHVVLSATAVPLVIHAVVLGLSHDVAELPRTIHPRVGRWAVAAWSTSLALGVLTYVLLNHVYAWTPMG